MKNADLSPRLRSAANFVRLGAVFADVGTDHAYLPLFLLEEGRISRAVCSDINRGPLESAIENAKARGLYDKMKFILTDGAAALAGHGITDLAICGMGGELIADIIETADFLKSDGVNLILQPMSKQAHLRKYLAASGFSVLSESYASEPHHNYVTMNVKYTASVREISSLEAWAGAPPYLPSDSDRMGYILERISALERAALGKERGNISADEERVLIKDIKSAFSIA